MGYTAHNGASWGLAFAAPRGFDLYRRGFVASLLPALVAWAAVLMGGRAGFEVLAAFFPVLPVYDLWIGRQQLAST